jgi:hypothetical protein
MERVSLAEEDAKGDSPVRENIPAISSQPLVLKEINVSVVFVAEEVSPIIEEPNDPVAFMAEEVSLIIEEPTDPGAFMAEEVGPIIKDPNDHTCCTEGEEEDSLPVLAK